MGEVIVDTCCLINLYATAELGTFLKDLSWPFYIARAALAEAIFIRIQDVDGDLISDPIDVRSFTSHGLITVADVEGAEEVELYVQLAAALEDGEAMGLAIAKVRSWALATDDRKARRLASKLGVKVLTTPELMQSWESVANITRSKMASMLKQIEFGARFAPADDAPGYDWWSSFVV